MPVAEQSCGRVAVLSESHGLGGMLSQIHWVLLCQLQVEEGLPSGDVLELPMQSLLGDLS